MARRCQLKQHLKKFHKLQDSALEDELRNTSSKMVENMNYIEPGNTAKRIFWPKVNVKAREETKIQRRILHEQLVHQIFPNLEGAVLVPRDHEAHFFKVPDRKGRQVLQLKTKPGW